MPYCMVIKFIRLGAHVLMMPWEMTYVLCIKKTRCNIQHENLNVKLIEKLQKTQQPSGTEAIQEVKAYIIAPDTMHIALHHIYSIQKVILRIGTVLF